MRDLSHAESLKVQQARRILFKAYMTCTLGTDTEVSRKMAYHYGEGLKAMSDESPLTFAQAMDVAEQRCDKVCALAHEDRETKIGQAAVILQEWKAEATQPQRPAILDVLALRDAELGPCN